MDGDERGCLATRARADVYWNGPPCREADTRSHRGSAVGQRVSHRGSRKLGAGLHQCQRHHRRAEIRHNGTGCTSTATPSSHLPTHHELTTYLSPGELLRLVLGLRGKTHRKELHLFARPRSLAFFHRHILELAEELHGGRWLTDATPNYFQSLTALQQYRVVLPHARLWVILRDPVDRCHQPLCRAPQRAP